MVVNDNSILALLPLACSSGNSDSYLTPPTPLSPVPDKPCVLSVVWGRNIDLIFFFICCRSLDPKETFGLCWTEGIQHNLFLLQA